MLRLGTDIGNQDIVMDFFAGSGSTAHAVLKQNLLDGGNRRFVLVQLPEPIEVEQFSKISQITIERVRRTISDMKKSNSEGILNEDVESDLGVKVFKLSESNFSTWNATVDHNKEKVTKQLELHIDHIRDDRTSEDILYELLLKSGYPLTTPVETIDLAGKPVYSVSGGALIIWVIDCAISSRDGSDPVREKRCNFGGSPPKNSRSVRTTPVAASRIVTLQRCFKASEGISPK